MKNHLMPWAKVMLQCAAFVTAIVIAWLAFSLLTGLCVVLMSPFPSQRMFHSYFLSVAYVQMVVLLMASLYEAGLVYMLRVICRMESIEHRAVMRLKNNPPLRVNP
ncbi:hypothetical protein DB346_10245 [Verrucomicrobia bacterium LW23]|nr:hypothetical protein DB346_10245 [Verrucomicrobia bacterium LW23]